MSSDNPQFGVPPHVLAASRAVLDLHDPSLRVAQLVGDSLVDAWLPPADGADRRLLFCSDDVRVDVTLRPSAAGLDLLVRLLTRSCPCERTDVDAGCPEHERRTANGPEADAGTVDHLEIVQRDQRQKLPISAAEGELDGLRPGLTSLVIPGDPATSRPGVRTAWFTV